MGNRYTTIQTNGNGTTDNSGSFVMNQNEVDNPGEYINPDYAKTNLDIVKEQHPGMSNAEGRLIVNAQNHRDSVRDRLADKEEILQQKRDNLYRTYLSMRENAETEAEKADRQRREKKAQRWAAVGDAISALANIGGAMGGATPIKPSKTLSQGQAERMEYARKLRELEQKKLSEHNKRRYDAATKEYDAARKDYNNGLKSLASANKNIEDATYKAMTLQNSAADKDQKQKNIDRAFDHTVEKDNTAAAQRQQQINNTRDYQQGQLALGHERNQISASKGSGGGRGSSSYHSNAKYFEDLGSQAAANDPNAYNNWLATQPKQQQKEYKKNPSSGRQAYGTVIHNGGYNPAPKQNNGGNGGGWASSLNRGKKK